jgi:hypothetical protein
MVTNKVTERALYPRAPGLARDGDPPVSIGKGTLSSVAVFEGYGSARRNRATVGGDQDYVGRTIVVVRIYAGCGRSCRNARVLRLDRRVQQKDQKGARCSEKV